MALPQIELHILSNADGSVKYIAPHGSCTIITGINYPVEVPYRSDELPDSTFIEVNLRPHNAVGMVKERHVESLVKRTLQTVVRVEETPRMMLQVTLQIASIEVDENLPGGIKGGGQGETYLPVLASAINAAILGCLDGGVRMKQIAGAALIGVARDGGIIASPKVLERQKCRSLHVFAFTSVGEIVLMESEGLFKSTDWECALSEARRQVLDERDTALLNVMRRSVEATAAHSQRWRET